VLRLLYLYYPRNIPQGRDYGGATFNFTNHREIAHLRFLLGVRAGKSCERKIVDLKILPACSVLLYHCRRRPAEILLILLRRWGWKAEHFVLKATQIWGAHPQGPAHRTPLPAIRLPNAGWVNEVNCPPCKSSSLPRIQPSSSRGRLQAHTVTANHQRLHILHVVYIHYTMEFAKFFPILRTCKQEAELTGHTWQCRGRRLEHLRGRQEELEFRATGWVRRSKRHHVR